MYFDALTLAAVADELRATILHGRIQRVLLPGPLSLGLEVYARQRRYQVLASAHPQMARIHLVEHKPSRGVDQATPLLLLLRKYILGGQIISIQQPSLERILMLSIVKDFKSRNPSDEMKPADEENLPDEAPPDELLSLETNQAALHSELIIEPMGRRSNILLVDDSNVILESVKRVTPRMSQRVVLPRQPYEVPPPRSGRDPRTATAEGIASLHGQNQTDLGRALVAGYGGVSPQAAREVVQRSLGQPHVEMRDDLPWERIATALRTLFSAPWEPTLVPGEEQPAAFAPYRITFLEGAQVQPGISVALETFYAARESWTAHNKRREAVQQQLDTARERLQHQLAQMAQELERVEDRDDLRWEGEMIFAFLHTLTPGQTTLEVEGRTITLDPERNPVACAQERFHAYQRARTGQERLQQRQREVQAQLAGLEQLSALLSVADERDQIEQIALEAAEQGYLPASGPPSKQQRRYARRKPLRLVSSDGITIYVGRSAAQNDEVTFRIGQANDLWLHARAIHGAHVILRSGGADIPERTLHEAAGLAAYFSQARAEAAVDIDVSRRSQVRKVPGGPPGLVTYRAERTIRVQPLPPWS